MARLQNATIHGEFRKLTAIEGRKVCLIWLKINDVVTNFFQCNMVQCIHCNFNCAEHVGRMEAHLNECAVYQDLKKEAAVRAGVSQPTITFPKRQSSLPIKRLT